MRTIELMDGTAIPVLGQGTWKMGNGGGTRPEEVAALRLGIDLGMTLIDTAEMYGDGRAEELVGEAIRGRRDEVFLVSKVLPSHASRDGVRKAAEGSLRRLGVEVLDLYLLHWPGSIAIAETLEGFERLKAEGKIRNFGVSNFDVGDMDRAWSEPGGPGIASNQILYNLERRGPERRLIPRCRQGQVNVMAYSPVDEGRLAVRPGLREVAERHGVAPYTVAIAWTIREDGLVSIPKASQQAHVRENAAAAGLELTPEDLDVLDRDYAPSLRDGPLETA